MRTSCIKVVSEGEDGSLRSLNNISPFSQVYREKDGTINAVKASLVFTEPADVARFTKLYPKEEIWIASADAPIEPRSWVFAYGFLNVLNSYGDDPAVIRMKELVLQCCNETERPGDDKELNEALDDVKKVLGYWVSNVPVVDAPIGTALASNLKLEKCIDFPEKYRLPFEKMVEQITKAFNDFNEDQAQMSQINESHQ